MKLKSNKELDLEKKIARFKELLSKPKTENGPEVPIDFLKSSIEEFQNELKEIQNRTKSPKTDFTVEFIHPHKKLDTGSPKQKYIEAIHEFGVENIKKKTPDFFRSNEKKGDERFAPNTYLSMGKSNDTMIASLKKVSKVTGRMVLINKIE